MLIVTNLWRKHFLNPYYRKGSPVNLPFLGIDVNTGGVFILAENLSVASLTKFNITQHNMAHNDTTQLYTTQYKVTQRDFIIVHNYTLLHHFLICVYM